MEYSQAAECSVEALEFKAHNNAVNQCHYLLDDSTVATCSDDGTVAFWKIKNGDNLLTIAGQHRRAVKAIGFNEYLHQMLSVSWDKSALMMDYHTKDPLWRVNYESLCTSCHIANSTNMAAVGCDNHLVYLLDTRTGNKISDTKNQKGHSNTVTSCQFSHDGQSLCTTSMDKSSIVWDIRSTKPLLRLTGHINIVSSCKFSSNDHYVCTSSWDKTVRLYDVSTGMYRCKGELLFQGHEGCVSNCGFSYDDSLLVSCGYDSRVMMHNLHTRGKVCSLKGNDCWIEDVRISKNGKWLLTCARDGIVKVWDTEADELVNKKTAVGIETSKCEQCGRMYTDIDIPDSLNGLCVFCRIENPQRSLEQILAPLK